MVIFQFNKKNFTLEFLRAKAELHPPEGAGLLLKNLPYVSLGWFFDGEFPIIAMEFHSHPLAWEFPILIPQLYPWGHEATTTY